VRSLSRARSRSAQIHKRARTDVSAVGAGGRTRVSGCPTGPGCFWALCSTKSRRKPILHSHGRVPGHQGVRFSQVVVGGFSPVEESPLTGRQAQSAPKVCPDSLLQAKPWRLMPKTPHPVARWSVIGFLWTSKVFTRVSSRPSRPPLARVDHLGVISRCRFSFSGRMSRSSDPYAMGLFRVVPRIEKCVEINRKKRKPRNCYQQSGAVFGSHPFNLRRSKVPICKA
jgi:hypothetical protein